MKIALLTAHDENMKEMGALSVSDKQHYCDKHGYTLIVVTEGFDKTRPAPWSKLLFLKDHLPSFDWILWADTDLLITNKDTALEHSIDNRFDLVMGIYEMNPAAVNPYERYTIHTGCFLIKNSPWIMAFIPLWYGQDQFKTTHLFEEKAFTWLYLSMRGVNQHTKILPLRTFCSMAPHYGIMGTRLQECIYRPGDFIMHFLEMSQNEKLSYMRKIYMDVQKEEV